MPRQVVAGRVVPGLQGDRPAWPARGASPGGAASRPQVSPPRRPAAVGGPGEGGVLFSGVCILGWDVPKVAVIGVGCVTRVAFSRVDWPRTVSCPSLKPGAAPFYTIHSM
ncbi:hypothetical protein NN561_018681 [Cricetulus griseus]